MPFCEVFTNVKTAEDFEIIIETIGSKNTEFFTDSLVIEQEARQRGYIINEIGRYFTYVVNTSLDPLYTEAIKNYNLFITHLRDLRYNEISLVDGFKSYLLERMILLEKIKSILEKVRKTNIVFLFNNSSYYHFAIHDLAQSMGYKSEFGVAFISSREQDQLPLIKRASSLIRLSKLGTRKKYESLDFRRTFALKYTSKYALSSKSKTEKDSEFNPSFSIDIMPKDKEAKYAFFLINNQENFYLRPVLPVIDEFIKRGTACSIFALSSRTTTQLKEMNLPVTDLSSSIGSLTKQMLNMNISIISAFLSRAGELSSSLQKSNVLKAYLMYFSNDYIVTNIARVIATIAILRRLFEKFKFKSILIGADGISENDLVCSIARTYRIPTYSIPPGIIGHYPIFGVLYNADTLLIPGPRLKHELMRIGVDEKRLIITGNPSYDYISNILQTKGLKPLIVFAMSRMHKDDEKYFIEAIRFCNKNNLDIFIKLHPSIKFTADQNKVGKQKIREIQEKCDGLSYAVSYDADLSKIMPRTSILITEESLVGVEASLNGKPIIVFNPNNENHFVNSVQYQKENIALYATSVKELTQCISRILSDSELNTHLEHARKVFNYEFNYLNDGKAANRIFNILTKE